MLVSDFTTVLKNTKPPFLPVLVIAQDENGKANPITIEWYMRTSITPPMFAISIGLTRYTHECLQSHRVFNIIVPSNEMGEEIKYCGLKSGRDCDKFADLNLEYFKGKLGLPILKKAKAAYECKVITQVLSGDHTIFVGEVKYSWLSQEKTSMFVFPEKL
mgnify:CR=1 FL=1